MQGIYRNNVRKVSSGDSVLGCRMGTCYAPEQSLRSALGEKTYGPTEDEKVSVAWVFHTPRGLAEIRDYWWNESDEWSIAAQSGRAAQWLAGYLRSLGFATGGIRVMRSRGGRIRPNASIPRRIDR